MCGISGIVGKAADQEIVERMTSSQKHRGPDGYGIWTAPGIALGHRRLRILDLSDAGKQPMSTPDGRYTIVYNGEVYNYLELRKELPVKQFHSQTDTEVVLQAFAHWGPECLKRFVGMYAIAIWDSYKQRLFCARDRLGIKPFYFTQFRESFFFASEIRGLLSAGLPRAVNERILYDFLARDFYEHSNETFFSDVNKLPPGSFMFVEDGRPENPQYYWDFAKEVSDLQVSRDPEEREEILLELCRNAVDIHLRSDVPIGVALSGGLDSATLLTLLDQTHPDPTRVEAFSFTFAEGDYSERPYVEEMAKHTGRKAHFIEVSARNFADTAERFVLSQEEPFAGGPISAYSLCFELARKHDFIVIMDGSGVDEGLAGYDRFLPAFWSDLFLERKWEQLDRELKACNIISESERRRAFDQMHDAMQPHADVGKGQDLTYSVRPDCLNPDFVTAAHEDPPRFKRPFHDNLRNLMYRELVHTKLPRALRFRDRLSMVVGMELRPPFLDHRLLAYEFALQPEDYINNGVSKAILRRAAARLLPDAVRLASKRSVQTPQREWFRNELKDWVWDRIDNASFWQRGWVDRKPGLAAMEVFFNGVGDNSFFLWQWINLEMWAQAFLDHT